MRRDEVREEPPRTYLDRARARTFFRVRWLSEVGSDARSAQGERRGRGIGLVLQSEGSTREETCSAICAHTESKMTRLRDTDRARQRRREEGNLLKSEEGVSAAQAGGRTARMEW